MSQAMRFVLTCAISLPSENEDETNYISYKVSFNILLNFVKKIIIIIKE